MIGSIPLLVMVVNVPAFLIPDHIAHVKSASRKLKIMGSVAVECLWLKEEAPVGKLGLLYISLALLRLTVRVDYIPLTGSLLPLRQE